MVGARIWQLMVEGRPLEQVCGTMLAEFYVSCEALEQDLDRLVTELAEKGLISLSS